MSLDFSLSEYMTIEKNKTDMFSTVIITVIQRCIEVLCEREVMWMKSVNWSVIWKQLSLEYFFLSSRYNRKVYSEVYNKSKCRCICALISCVSNALMDVSHACERCHVFQQSHQTYWSIRRDLMTQQRLRIPAARSVNTWMLFDSLEVAAVNNN